VSNERAPELLTANSVADRPCLQLACNLAAEIRHYYEMNAIAVIPARLGSTRLPRKMLREINGQPLLAFVYRAVTSSNLLDDVIIATDSEEIVRVCRDNNWNVRLTSAAHRNGTERVCELATSIPAEVYINVQGDEPLVSPEHLAALLELMKDPSVQVGTLKAPASPADVKNPNAVKVVTDSAGRALYFSRSIIPFDRDGTRPAYYTHLGIYAYRKPALERYCSLQESILERSERLEQLRFLENGIPIYVGETAYETVRVDTEEDFRRLEKLLLIR
jgi:3-deoxy-manno-octulosonate cytidylyltransferase (CMP-KDO synthetase)